MATKTQPEQITVNNGRFIEAREEGSKFLIRVIQAGLSANKIFYPDAVLREAAPMFSGVRVFAKTDEEHIKGKGKSIHNLIGRLSKASFIEGDKKDTGEIQAEFEVLQSVEFSAVLREAVERGMSDDLYGFSIDALGTGVKKRFSRYREAKSFTKVNSVDLIVDAAAGGQFMKMIEAIEPDDPKESADVALRERMIEAVKKANKGSLPSGLDIEDDEALEVAYREAVTPEPPKKPKEKPAADGLSADDVEERIRMAEARSNARVTIAGCGLPEVSRDRLMAQFANNERFVEADVTAAIKAEREYLGKVTQTGRVEGLGDASFIEGGEDRSEKVQAMLDDFFDPAKPAMSFRECYIEVTGDRGVTGLYQNCDAQRMREAVGDVDFREAVSAATFSNVLGDSITRAMLRDYNAQDLWNDWRWLVDVVPVNDFRTQERTRVGGYGDLPAVAENGAYNPLTTPNDEKVTYALSKKGGTEIVSLEAIANDDVGLIQRIPMKLGVSAKRTLFKFIFGFIDANGAIYDTLALFHASHNNLATAALDNTSFAAARLAMSQQAEMDSNERLGLVVQHLAVPGELEEAAYDMFVRNTNNDETFVQSRKPMVHVIPHWTDVNNWFATADRREIPLIELGFYNGQEEPELFVQDNPSQGSLFSNDQIKYKIRHIYNGAVSDFRGFHGNIVI
ncbi:MAG: hypothetical protein JMN25_15760 [gamma proteobacterium endosymbiont of Lamellibrachia anaximandri]|nr:hypothetical protein [gamma proteobacterium endosymbiont of Lamellibrachia anaximandri]